MSLNAILLFKIVEINLDQLQLYHNLRLIISNRLIIYLYNKLFSSTWKFQFDESKSLGTSTTLISDIFISIIIDRINPESDFKYINK